MKAGRTHVDADQGSTPFGDHAARAGLPHDPLAGDAVVGDIRGEAAHSVAAHLRLTAVGVDQPHPQVGAAALLDQEDAVGADAGSPAADPPCQRRPVDGRGITVVDDDEVVPQTVHLLEEHR